MSITATSISASCDGRPAFRPYRWHGKPVPAAPPASRPPSGRKREPSKSQEAYRERLAALTEMRIHEKPGDNFPPPGVLTVAQAARQLGVTERTLLRYRQILRKAGAS